MICIQFNDDNRVKAVQRWHGTVWLWQQLGDTEDAEGRTVRAWLTVDKYSTRSLHQFLKTEGITKQDAGLIVL